MLKKKIAILGSTGSIGQSALSVIGSHADKFEITALTAHTNISLLKKQIAEFKPSYVALTGECGFYADFPDFVTVKTGQDSVFEACLGADIVLLAIMGIAGLPAFEFCLNNRIPVALATKEAMVCGGRAARELMDKTGTPVLPVDSELSAIWQCLDGNTKGDVKRILLTASGGPFREWTKERIAKAGVSDALNHPNWSMGKKITVDCATLANKGLEIMETRWLFDMSPEQITVVVHPESIIHSMVEFKDNAILAQLGDKDMRIPILHALSYPERLENCEPSLDIFGLGALHFERPDTGKFPCLALAYEAVKNDGALQLVFNSANEIAVELFLQGKIAFAEIYSMIERAMKSFSDVKVSSFADVYGLDKEVRSFLAHM